MKTNYPIHLKKCGFFFIGIVAIITTSCGSYQNVSYYENDGIYSTSTTKKESVSRTNNEVTPEKSDEYAQKFRAMQNDYTYFTDVDTYQSTSPQDTVVTVYNTDYNDQNYAGWGNNASTVTINYYNNGYGWNNWYSPYWGYSNAGWGWNSWYGNNWGWGWNSWYGPNWGYGWNAWYGNGYYGPGWGGYYNNNWGWYGSGGRNVAYNGGRRGGNGYYNSGSGRNGSYTNHGRRSDVSNYNGTPRTVTPRNSFQNPRSSQQININPRATGSQSYAPRENSTVTPRTNTSEPRNTNSTSEPRNNNYTPRNNSNFSSPRSSSSGGNFGGGGSSSGGGRSGGGGGRGGRG